MNKKTICDECYKCLNYIDNNDEYTCQGSNEKCHEFINMNEIYGVNYEKHYSNNYIVNIDICDTNNYC